MDHAKLTAAIQMLQGLVSLTGQHLQCPSDESLISLTRSVAQFGHELLGAWYGRVVIVAGDRKVAVRFERNGISVSHVYRLGQSDDRLFSLNPCSMSGPSNQFISCGIGYDDRLARQKGVAGLVEFAQSPEGTDGFPPETAYIVELLCKIIGNMLIEWLPELKKQALIEVP